MRGVSDGHAVSRLCDTRGALMRREITGRDVVKGNG